MTNSVDRHLIWVNTVCSGACVRILRVFMGHLSQRITNLQNGMCAKRRLRSAWASAQSDQRLRCPIERTAKILMPGRMPSLIWVLAGRTCHFVGFVVRWLFYKRAFSPNPALRINWKKSFSELVECIIKKVRWQTTNKCKRAAPCWKWVIMPFVQNEDPDQRVKPCN